MCQVADKTMCGCDNVDKFDFRCTFNRANDSTESYRVCVRWDDEWLNGFFSEDEVVKLAGFWKKITATFLIMTHLDLVDICLLSNSFHSRVQSKLLQC